MVTHLSGKLPSVLAYSRKQVTSKLKLPFYSAERFGRRSGGEGHGVGVWGGQMKIRDLATHGKIFL